MNVPATMAWLLTLVRVDSMKNMRSLWTSYSMAVMADTILALSLLWTANARRSTTA